MKKFLILCLVAALLLVGCNKQTSSEPELTPVTDPATDPVTDPAQTSGSAENDPNATVPPEASLQSFGYAQGTPDSVTVTHVAKGISANVSANGVLKAGLMSLKYDPNQKKTDVGAAAYELKINGKSLLVYAENVAAYDGSDPYACSSFDLLAYLGGLFVGEATTLSGYAADAAIKLQNNEGKVAQVSDKAAFFTELGKVRVIQLAHAADYTVPTAEYTVEIGEERMEICGSYLKIGADLYAVIEGDFAFLAGYTFGSSSGGWLPWI